MTWKEMTRSSITATSSDKKRTMRLVLSLVFFVCVCSSIASAVTVQEMFDNAKSRYGPIPEGITVGVYYYPWHADDFHRGSRNDGYLRGKLQPPQQPMLGEYDDRRPDVIAQHLAWSRQANVKLWVCSWWGPDRREDQTIRSTILPHSDLGSHKIALLYEGSGRGIKASSGWDTSAVYSDLQFICSNYFDHPNYYHLNGKPVIVIYLSRLMQDSGVLETVITNMRQGARDNCGKEIFIVGDHIWNYPPVEDPNYLPFQPGMLDAVTK
jgi:hypothetical protein